GQVVMDLRAPHTFRLRIADDPRDVWIALNVLVRSEVDLAEDLAAAVAFAVALQLRHLKPEPAALVHLERAQCGGRAIAPRPDDVATDVRCPVELLRDANEAELAPFKFERFFARQVEITA